VIYEFQCEQCGKDVCVKRAASRKPPRFCSQACTGASRRGTGRGPTPNHTVLCESCGERRDVYRSPSAPAPRFCSVHCTGAAQRGEANPAYSGGRHVGANGYVYVLAPDHPHANCRGYVLEHRLAMESHLGRHLTPVEVVHHANRDTTDNRIENLVLCADQAEHLAIHAAEDQA
jgi:hypothetical protein